MVGLSRNRNALIRRSWYTVEKSTQKKAAVVLFCRAHKSWMTATWPCANNASNFVDQCYPLLIIRLHPDNETHCATCRCASRFSWLGSKMLKASSLCANTFRN
mmetsp:Transcript_53927/g.145282  ORF Transcript_53927/g.145282 Transcript_53927/m.145282 type:complete len:103 (-) Transcript_53927:1948-2256(-)